MMLRLVCAALIAPFEIWYDRNAKSCKMQVF